jgi:hypothetical protein
MFDISRGQKWFLKNLLSAVEWSTGGTGTEVKRLHRLTE